MCPRCYRRSKKASKKALAHPKDHLERYLRQIHGTQVAHRQFWTRQKRQKDFRTSNENLATWNLFSIEGAPQFAEPLKRLCAIRCLTTNIFKLYSLGWAHGEHILYKYNITLLYSLWRNAQHLLISIPKVKRKDKNYVILKFTGIQKCCWLCSLLWLDICKAKS